MLAGLGLELKAAKTRIVHLAEGKDARGWISSASTTGGCGLGARCARAGYVSWPAGPRARRRSTPGTGFGRSQTGRRLLWSNEWIVRELNRFLRGWGGYFRYGNSAGIFDAISQYALERLAGFVGKRHKRSRRWGMRLVTCGSPDNLGLITLCGTVIAPRPFRPWRAPAERRR